MTPFSISLIFLAAVMHAAWNLLLKQEKHKYIASWWASLTGFIFLSPLLFFFPLPKPSSWLFAIVSGGLEAAYMIALATAYYRGDYSLVYPISRGAAPAFLVLWAVIFLRESPSVAGLVGIVLIIAGLLLVSGSVFRYKNGEREIRSSTYLRAVLWALVVALFISFYSVIDGAAMKQTNPVSYIVLVFGIMTLCITPFVRRRYGWNAMVAEWRSRWLCLTIMGSLSILAYLLVLVVYVLSPVSYAGTIREVSVVFAAIAGAKYLGEGFGRSRIIGAIIIFCGVLLIAIRG